MPKNGPAWAWTLFNGLPDAVIITDAARRIRGWNLRAAEAYGYQEASALGQDLLALPPFVGPLGLGALLQQSLAGGAASDLSQMVFDVHGRGLVAMRLESGDSPAADLEAFQGGGLAVMIHEPHQGEDEEIGTLRGRVQRKRALLETLLNHLALGLMVVEAPGGTVFMTNREAEKYVSDMPLPYPEAAVSNTTGAKRLDGTPYAASETPLARALRGELVRQEELVKRRPDGTPVPFSVNASPVMDPTGRVMFAIATFEDISERFARDQEMRDKEAQLSKLNARLLHDALHDTLTDLPNRALLLDRLEQMLQRRLADPSRDAALLYLDFDRFKVVNDSLGHSVGDAMLIEIGKALSKTMRPEDTVARLGGDEFVILMDHLDTPNRALDLADRIRKTFDRPLRVQERNIFTSASIGIVPSLLGYMDPDDVLRDADTAMYAAKAAGRDTYRVFDQHMRHQALEALELENALRQALTKGEFTAHYVPIHRLNDGHVVGFQASICWQHPTRGPLPPREFLRTANDMGIGREIDQLVWLQACRALNSWRERFSPSLLLSLHFNARHFLSAQPEKQLLGLLAQTGTSPQRTAIELAEGTLTDASGAAEAALLRVVQQGVGLHLDNFGSGHHSLYNLQRFNVGAIKVDSNVVAHLTTDPKSVELTRAMTAMATSLKMSVIAKGVVTETQRQKLLELGCAFGQGSLFSDTLDEAAALKLLGRQRWPAASGEPQL